MRVMRKLKALVGAPRYVAGMQNVYRAAASEDWARVAEVIERLHGRALVTDTSRHWLGIAYLKLARWRDALEEYEGIDRPLANHDAEARRTLNHALAHYRTGNPERCATMLQEGINPDWPAPEMRKARTILNEIEQEH